MKRLLQGILLLTLFTACQKQDMASLAQNKEAANAANNVDAKTYASTMIQPSLLEMYDWGNQVPIKRNDSLIAVKILHASNQNEKLVYLMIHHGKNGWGDIVEHEISYRKKVGVGMPERITSKSLLTKRTGTKILSQSYNEDLQGRGGTQKKSLVSPGGTLPMVTIVGTYTNGNTVSAPATNYFLINGGLSSSSSGSDGGNDAPGSGNDNYQHLDYLDPMYTPDAGGGNGGLLPYYNLEDTRIVNGIVYTTSSYPGKDLGYPWLWWEIWDNFDPNNPFANGDNPPLDAIDRELIFNGIDVEDAPLGSFTGNMPTRKIAFSPDRRIRDGNGNLLDEDMQHGTNGNDAQVFKIFPDTKDQLISEMKRLFELHTIRDAGLGKVAENFIDIFKNNTTSKSTVTSNTLTERVKNSVAVVNYLKRFGEKLQNELRQNNGDINSIINIDMEGRRPIFNSFYDKFHGLQILINDTEYTEVKLNDFYVTPDGRWGATVTVEIYDHFGVDLNDALKFQFFNSGFAAWWRLQHMKDLKPFTTKIVFTKLITGTL